MTDDAAVLTPLEVMPTANGWRAHVPFCHGPFQRYMTILADRGMRPFQRAPHEFGPRVLGELLPLRWRVSPDEMWRLALEVEARYGWTVGSIESRLFGWPIEADAALPPGTILLESGEALG